MSEQLSPQDRAWIQEYTMKAAEAAVLTLNPQPFADAVDEISAELGINPIPVMEEILRAKNSAIHLVAMPMTENHVASSEYTCELPHTKRHFPYYLFASLSKKDFLEMISEAKSTPEENFRNLHLTGVLRPKPNSRTARASN